LSTVAAGSLAAGGCAADTLGTEELLHATSKPNDPATISDCKTRFILCLVTTRTNPIT
jgi:hypothetical protein